MHRLLLTVVVLTLAGCANMNTVNRATPLPGGGKAVHLDSAQRLVYTSKDGMLCAEPTPDAIQAYAAAMGVSAGVNDKGSAALSNALSANSASVGLHTQSITLMRDTLYRICEFSHNKGANQLDTVQLLQRSQDLTLGVLAIEQLTGAVVARQAMLTGGSSSTSSASIQDAKAQLKTALANEASRRKELDAATKAERKQQALVTKAQAAVNTESERDPVDEEKLAKVTKAAEDAQAALVEKTAAVASAKEAYDRAVATTTSAASLYNTALAAGSADTTGTGSTSGGSTTAKVDEVTAQVLANATTKIVEMVLNKGHLTDTCMNFLIRHSEADADRARTDRILAEQCTKVIEAGVAQHMAPDNSQLAAACASFMTRQVSAAESKTSEYKTLSAQCTKLIESSLSQGVRNGMARTEPRPALTTFIPETSPAWMSLQLDKEKMKALSEQLKALDAADKAARDKQAGKN